MNDIYTWSVIFTDGTALHEYDEARPDGRDWSERGEQPVTHVVLMTQDGDPAHCVAVPAGATPIFLRRRAVLFDVNTDDPSPEHSEPVTVAHCIGWKDDARAVYLFAFGDGSTLLSDDLQAI